VLPAYPTATAPSLRTFVDHPDHTAELLALTAVARYGPAARTNVSWLRDTYPNATAEGVSRVAMHRYIRLARNRGVVSGLVGPVAVLIDASTLGVLHAQLILNIAAAHGLDPAAPERAAELLYLQEVHDDVGTARAALETATDPEREPTMPDPARYARPLVRTVGLGALRVGARRLVQFIPGAGAVIGALANARATEEVANRALRFYRQRAAS
jgi:hypothetical protein